MTEWQVKIGELKKSGLTQKQIADQINCSQNYVSDLERGVCGKRLSYEFGKKLDGLYQKHCSSHMVI